MEISLKILSKAWYGNFSIGAQLGTPGDCTPSLDDNSAPELNETPCHDCKNVSPTSAISHD